MVSRLLAVFMLAIAAACSAPSPFPANTGAIVSQDLINQSSCGRFPRYSDSAWTPTADAIAPLERALIERLVPELERDAEHNRYTPAATDYYRRYAGVTFQGQRLIAVCAEARKMYDERNVDWRTTPISFRDGGSQSFSAHYDPATGEITYFAFGYVG